MERTEQPHGLYVAVPCRRDNNVDNSNCTGGKCDECNDQRFGGKHVVPVSVDGNERQRFRNFDAECNDKCRGTSGTDEFDEYGTDG